MHSCSHANFIQNVLLWENQVSHITTLWHSSTLRQNQGPSSAHWPVFIAAVFLNSPFFPPVFQSSSLVIFPLWNFVWPTHIFLSHPTNLCRPPPATPANHLKGRNRIVNERNWGTEIGRQVCLQTIVLLRIGAVGVWLFVASLRFHFFSPPLHFSLLLLVRSIWKQTWFYFQTPSSCPSRPLQSSSDLKGSSDWKKERRRNICRSRYLWSAVSDPCITFYFASSVAVMGDYTASRASRPPQKWLLLCFVLINKRFQWHIGASGHRKSLARRNSSGPLWSLGNGVTVLAPPVTL